MIFSLNRLAECIVIEMVLLSILAPNDWPIIFRRGSTPLFYR